MIERAFRHTALASHFLILFSLYLYFFAKKYKHSHREWFFILLSVLSVLIHPYFLPMVMGLLFATELDRVIYNREWKMPLVLLCASIAGVLVTSWMIGIFTVGGGVLQGYGYFSMNVNALINPVSTNLIQCGATETTYHWSKIIPVLPQSGGNYDGFNYFGFGMLVLLFICSCGCVFDLICKKGYRKKFIRSLYNYFALFCVCVLLFMRLLMLLRLMGIVLFFRFPKV